MFTESGLFWVGLGGGLGACGRYWLTNVCNEKVGRDFPYGTLCVNVLGSCVMGGLAGAFRGGLIPFTPWHDFLSEGFLGALTTFSTFSAETFHQYARGECLKGSLNMLLNITFCILGAAAGFFMTV